MDRLEQRMKAVCRWIEHVRPGCEAVMGPFCPDSRRYRDIAILNIFCKVENGEYWEVCGAVEAVVGDSDDLVMAKIKQIGHSAIDYITEHTDIELWLTSKFKVSYSGKWAKFPDYWIDENDRCQYGGEDGPVWIERGELAAWASAS